MKGSKCLKWEMTLNCLSIFFCVRDIWAKGSSCTKCHKDQHICWINCCPSMHIKCFFSKHFHNASKITGHFFYFFSALSFAYYSYQILEHQGKRENFFLVSSTQKHSNAGFSVLEWCSSILCSQPTHSTFWQAIPYQYLKILRCILVDAKCDNEIRFLLL